MRLVLVCLIALAAVPAAAQPLAPGTRVRVEVPSGAEAVVGVVRVAGDTLVVETEAGAVVAPGADARVEVSAGRPPFPLWVIAGGTAAGVGVGYALAQTAATRDRCRGPYFFGCGTERSGEYEILLGLGTAAGLVGSTWLALRMARERWEPVGELAPAPGGVAWRIGL